MSIDRAHSIPYSRKLWQGIKFGSLAVYCCNCQIKIFQYFILTYNYICIVIPYWTIQFNIFAMAVGAQLPNLITFNISSYTVYTPAHVHNWAGRDRQQTQVQCSLSFRCRQSVWVCALKTSSIQNKLGMGRHKNFVRLP